MLFWFFSYLVCIVVLAAGLGIEDRSNDPLAPCPDCEGVYAGGVISPAGGSLLPAHVVCQGKFILVVIFFSCLLEHTSHNMTQCCVIVCVLFPPEEPLQSPNFSPAVRPCLHVLQFLSRFLSRISSKVDSTSPRASLILSPHLQLVASQRPIESS